MKNEITWSASNNSSFLNGSVVAKTELGAVRAARAYLDSELQGEGKITYYKEGVEYRVDEKSIFTGYKWKTYNQF